YSVRTSARARRRPVRIAAAPSAATSTAGRNGSASAGGTSRSSSASATENGPTSSRRRVRQCPPSASAIERTYVPDPTRRSRRAMPSAYSSSSSDDTRERRTGISTVWPRRCKRYARSPPTLTADSVGTAMSTSPRSPFSRASSSPPPVGADSWTTSPSGSPVDVRAPRSTSVTYRLSRPTSHGASLVAAPESTSRRPVANGSSVPAWPVRARVRRRIAAITWNDDGPAGLSTRKSPDGSSARGGIGELAADELDDLLDRLVAREAGRASMPAAAPLAGDRGDVQGVRRRAHRDATRSARRLGRFTDGHRQLDAVDLAQLVDHTLGVLLPHAQLLEVGAQEVARDHPVLLVAARPRQRLADQLLALERNRLVDLPEHLVGLDALLEQVGREPVRP